MENMKRAPNIEVEKGQKGLLYKLAMLRETK
jgi:hypothetical protein